MPTKEKMKQYQQTYLAKPGVREKRRAWARAWVAKNKAHYFTTKADYRYKLKVAALEHYGGTPPACKLCGFCADMDALCLDHINDDGSAHRKSLRISHRAFSGGTTIYERLKALGWMDCLQVLCANCNMIKELRRKRGGVTAAQRLHEVSNRKRRWRADP